MITTIQAAALDHFGAGQEKEMNARRKAAKLFDREYAQARRGRLWAKLVGKWQNLPEIPRGIKAARRTTAVQTVSLEKIVGSEGRSEDFDAKFRPLKMSDRERWIGVAAARRMGNILPAVDLIQVGDHFYVRDGHHRISTARAAGQREIDARLVN